VKNGKQMRCDEKEKARPDLAGGPIVSGPEINGGRESWSLHRRVNFRHPPLLCGLPPPLLPRLPPPPPPCELPPPL